MLYRLLRAVARLALRYFYRDIDVVGLERVPERGPLLIAVNHPNALVDPLIVGTVISRPITLTAKATLFEHAMLRPLLHAVGVVPLRRASDERSRDPAAAADPRRNAEAFAAMIAALTAGRAILIFPEGKSHNAPGIAPLKTGLARVALLAHEAHPDLAVRILPIGLTFERKWRPRSRVLVEIGEPFEVSAFHADARRDETPAEQLTALIDARLRDVTLNFGSGEESLVVRRRARVLADLLEGARPLGDADARMAERVLVARAIQSVERALVREHGERAAAFVARLASFEAELVDRGIAVSDVRLDPGIMAGTRFAVRETAIALVALPLAVWGFVNHWIPLRIAAVAGERASRHPEDPAQNTILAGLVAVLAFFAIQAAVVWRFFGALWAMVYVVTLPFCGTWDLRYRERLVRARARVRAFFALRGDAQLRARLNADADWLRDEALALNAIGEAQRGSAVTGGK